MLLSILAGVSIVLARIINANLAKVIGLFQGAFYNYIVGLFVSLLLLFLRKESLNITDATFDSIPRWAYLGGFIGVLVVVLSSFLTHKISVFYLTLLIFIGQLFVGTIIDYFTFNQLSIGKIIGGILVLSGLTYNLVLDQKKSEQFSIDN